MAVKTLKNCSAVKQENCIFTRPAFEKWPSLLESNSKSLSCFGDTGTFKAELLSIAIKYTAKLGLPGPHVQNSDNIIVTGHQPNWHHCGILAKNIITDIFARQINAAAVVLVLDHDICNTSMFVPEFENDRLLEVKAISLEKKNINIPLESRPKASKKRLKKFLSSILQTSGKSFCSKIWAADLLGIIEESSCCKNIADTVTQLQGRLNSALGLDLLYLPVSLMSQSESFNEFICLILSNAGKFAEIYNAAISNKRKNENLKPHQTLRPLKIDPVNNIVELPFWLVRRTGKRQSLYASVDRKNPAIGTQENTIAVIDTSIDKARLLADTLRKTGYMIRPKAVALTLFTRLCLTQLFVHGTGAINYEYITDDLIEKFYSMPTPDFAVATATMTKPFESTENLKIARQVLDYREFFFGLFSKDRLKDLISSAGGTL